MALDAKTLCVRINEAFGRVPYPGDDRLVFEDAAVDIEAERIKNALKGRHWRDISFATLSAVPSALSFLSPDGYRFYLPAFLVFSVAAFHQANPVPHEVIQSLTLPDLADLRQTEELAAQHAEAQPFSADEWQRILATVERDYKSGIPGRTFFERMSGFDAEQKEVIFEFLKHIRDFYMTEFPNREPEKAIERFWGSIAR